MRRAEEPRSAAEPRTSPRAGRGGPPAAGSPRPPPRSLVPQPRSPRSSHRLRPAARVPAARSRSPGPRGLRPARVKLPRTPIKLRSELRNTGPPSRPWLRLRGAVCGAGPLRAPPRPPRTPAAPPPPCPAAPRAPAAAKGTRDITVPVPRRAPRPPRAPAAPPPPRPGPRRGEGNVPHPRRTPSPRRAPPHSGPPPGEGNAGRGAPLTARLDLRDSRPQNAPTAARAFWKLGGGGAGGAAPRGGTGGRMGTAHGAARSAPAQARPPTAARRARGESSIFSPRHSRAIQPAVLGEVEGPCQAESRLKRSGRRGEPVGPGTEDVDRIGKGPGSPSQGLPQIQPCPPPGHVGPRPPH
ncbi:atherin [Dipodomys merriami]|uniref:atherin n=1 Tax=Dipodomys merriami TaxID=94247 RepID=UPI0038513CE8